MKRAAVVLACLASVAAVAGCGGGDGSNALSKDDYEQQMQALEGRVSSAANELSVAFSNPSDIAAVSNGLEQAAVLLDDASETLDGIEPPEDVANQHQAMIDSSAAAAERMRDLADKVEGESPSELQQDLSTFSFDELTTFDAAVSEIKAKGYDIGG